MNANEFIKKFGLDDAKNIVCGWIRRDFDDSYHISEGIYCNLPFEPTEDCGTLSLFDLKRLVESHELVDKVGGMDKAKLLLRMRIAAELYESADEIEKAILDVESCQ